MNVSQICSGRNIVIDPQRVDADKASDLALLPEITALQAMLASVNKLMDLATPPADDKFQSNFAKGVYQFELGQARSANQTQKTLEALKAAIDGIDDKLKTAAPADKEKLQHDRDMLAGLANNLNLEINNYKELQKKQTSVVKGPMESSAAEIATELKKVLRDQSFKLHQTTRNALSIGVEGWMESASVILAIDRFINDTCNSAKAGNGQRPTAKPETPAQKTWDFSGRAGAGYSSLHNNSGPYGLYGLTVGYHLNPKTIVQLDARGQLDMAGNGKESRSASDTYTGTLQYRGENTQLHFQGGYFAYLNTTLDESARRFYPDQSGAIQNGRFVYSFPKSRFSFSLTDYFTAGKMGDSKQISVQGQPAIIARFGDFQAYLGGSGGYDKQKSGAFGGGFAGAYFQKGKNEAGARFDYSSAYGLLAQARVMVNIGPFGL
ncbi:MAG: hypothetical protein PHG97_02365, partial [Candidatus Margulisbacteria bacterium]|nr:hypothetical protein [Candidatus Margulisiibacteriota bacterium]